MRQLRNRPAPGASRLRRAGALRSHSSIGFYHLKITGAGNQNAAGDKNPQPHIFSGLIESIRKIAPKTTVIGTFVFGVDGWRYEPLFSPITRF